MLSGGGSLFNNPANNSSSGGSGGGLFSAAANNNLLGQQQTATPTSNIFGNAGNSSTSLFGNSAASSTLFGTNKPTLGLFSNDKTASQDKSSLFSNIGTPAPISQDNAAAKTTPSLFANNNSQKPTSTLFGNKPADQTAVTSLFASKPSDQPATSLFGAKANEQPVTSLFGSTTAATKPSDQPVTSLFGGTPAAKPADPSTTSLFGAPSKPVDKPSTSLFSQQPNKPADPTPTPSLFGAATANATSNDKQAGATNRPDQSAGSLFDTKTTKEGGQQQSTSLFSKPSGSTEGGKAPETSLFGGGTSSLFGDPSKDGKSGNAINETKTDGPKTSPPGGQTGVKTASDISNKGATQNVDKNAVKEVEFAIEQLEQEKIEQLVSVWERKLTRQVDEFKRYSRAIVDMDATLFEYVEKIITIQKQQDRLEGRQKDLLSVIEKVEISQTAMLDTITVMEQRVRNRLPEGENVSNSLQTKASMLSHQIVDLENQVLELTKDLDRLEFKLYPEGLGQLSFLTNNHARAIERANQQTEQLSKLLLQKSRPRDI